jgi:hypothetical protein
MNSPLRLTRSERNRIEQLTGNVPKHPANTRNDFVTEDGIVVAGNQMTQDRRDRQYGGIALGQFRAQIGFDRTIGSSRNNSLDHQAALAEVG